MSEDKCLGCLRLFRERGGYRRGKRLALAICCIAIGASPRFVNRNNSIDEWCGDITLIAMINRVEEQYQYLNCSVNMRSFHEWLGSNRSVAVALGDSRTVTVVTAFTSV